MNLEGAILWLIEPVTGDSGQQCSAVDHVEQEHGSSVQGTEIAGFLEDLL